MEHAMDIGLFYSVIAVSNRTVNTRSLPIAEVVPHRTGAFRKALKV
jgi:hypothetical protein